MNVPEGVAQNGGQSRAVFTIAQNEATFLPLWLAYYARFFEPQDIYILDHDSTDGSTTGLGARCRIVAVHRKESFDHVWLKTTVERFQAFLLQSYDVVLFTEADEFVIPDPARYSGLANYITLLDQPAARCSGYNVVHQPGEAPLRCDMSILRQRRYWRRSRAYDKSLLSSVPLVWTPGFHEESSMSREVDPGLFLVHLHRIDYEICQRRHRSAASRRWNPPDLEHRFGWQNLIVDDEAFDEWFYRGADLEDAPVEEIPSGVREVI